MNSDEFIQKLLQRRDALCFLNGRINTLKQILEKHSQALALGLEYSDIFNFVIGEAKAMLHEARELHKKMDQLINKEKKDES